ncbi:hypothetical protein OQA88_9878 [Cercophora sp. LCS_1]
MARRRRPPRSGALTELPPLKILSQILALQAIYYAIAFILLLFTTLVAGTPFSLDLVFGWSTVRGDTTQGWLMGFIWILDGGLFMAAALVILISRSKLVLDFAVSLHLIHLLVVWFYTGEIPRHTAWWLSMGSATVVAVGLGTWGCRYRELRPISFGGIGGGTAAGAGSSGDVNEEGGHHEAGDEEQGFSTRGRGRGRGRDGAGEYEMVKMDGEVER